MTLKRIDFVKTLSDDLDTGGHLLGDVVREMTDYDLQSLDNILSHWKFQVKHEINRRQGRVRASGEGAVDSTYVATDGGEER